MASQRTTLRCSAISPVTVVIGGGITGALVAVHLAEVGVKTLLIDKRDIGTGSNSASTALLHGKLERLATRLKIDCGFERKPSLFLARHQWEIPGLREEFRLRRKMGIDLEFFDVAAIQKRYRRSPRGTGNVSLGRAARRISICESPAQWRVIDHHPHRPDNSMS